MTAGASEDRFRLLTEQHTFIVVDTETCLAEDNRGNRVIQLAVLPVVRGQAPGRCQAWYINPGEPVDADSYETHQIDDAQLAGKWPFRRLRKRIDTAIRGTDTAPTDTSVVFVGHFAGYDAAALRGEYARADSAMPDLPVLDTMRLAAQLDVGCGAQPSLRKLAKRFKIPQAAAHDARDDARVTSRVLIALLREAANQGHTDLDALLRQHRAGSTLTATGGRSTRTRREREPVLDDAHLATHAELLQPHADTAQLDAWVEDAVGCARLRCPLLREKASLATEHAGRLIPKMSDRLPQLDAPGQAATLVGAITVLASSAFPKGDKAVSAWDALAPRVTAAAPCAAGARCPACRDAEPCPLDVAHHAFARAFIGEPATATTLNRFSGTGNDRVLDRWVRRGRRSLAAHATWFLLDQLAGDTNANRASALLDKAAAYGLERDDPRLALALATSLALQGDVEAGATLAVVALEVRTSDDGYALLDDWLHGPCEELRRRHQRPVAREGRKLRTARPPGRDRINRFKR